MSWELLVDVVAWVETRQVLLIMTSRKRGAPTCHSDSAIPPVSSIRLGPLAESESQDLLGALIAGSQRGRNARFREWCAASAGGNPYYLTEIAHHGFQDDNGFRPPASLAKLIGDGLARLSAVSRRVLRPVACWGSY
jgi:hypothetical protein